MGPLKSSEFLVKRGPGLFICVLFQTPILEEFLNPIILNYSRMIIGFTIKGDIIMCPYGAWENLAPKVTGLH